jgi:Ca-activated chloride channel family protein
MRVHLLLISVACAALATVTPSRADENTPLFRAADAVPVLKETVSVHIDRRWAITEHRQVVVSSSPGQAEGVYQMSLAENAVATQFSYWNGEKEIRGELLERGDATAMYDAVTRTRRDPGVLEETAPGQIRYRIFPFAPREAKRVLVRWEALLPAHGATVELKTPIARPSSAVVVDLEGAAPGSIRSSTHEIVVEPNGRGLRVTTTAPKHFQNELALTYDLAAPGATAQLHAEPGREAFVALDFPPPEPGTKQPAHDVTFLVDRSASESAATFDRTRLALRAAIAHLSSRDRVNVIAFDDTVTPLFATPRPASEDVVRQATSFVAHLRDGAGTDLPNALHAAFTSQEGDADRDRLVVLVSDGAVDREASLSTAKSERADVRLSVLALGDAAGTDLLTQLAQERGGVVEVARGDATTALARLYDKSTRPALLHAKLEISGAAGAVLAAPVPQTLAAGERLLVPLRCRPHGVLHARLSGDVAGAAYASTIDLDLASGQSRPWLATAWAKAHVDGTADRQDALETALTYGLVTKQTAFFAIPESEAIRVQGQLADARAKKRWLTEDPSDVGPAETARTEIASLGNVSPAPPPPAREPSDMVHPAVLERSHSGGCAGCAASGSDAKGRDLALASITLAFAVASIRRRRNGGAS